MTFGQLEVQINSSWTSPIKLPSIEWHKTSLMVRQHCFRQWLGAIMQQAITWTSIDQVPWHLMASLGHNELMMKIECTFSTQQIYTQSSLSKVTNIRLNQTLRIYLLVSLWIILQR